MMLKFGLLVVIRYSMNVLSVVLMICVMMYGVRLCVGKWLVIVRLMFIVGFRW